METKLETLIADIDKLFTAPTLLGTKKPEKPSFSIVTIDEAGKRRVEFQLIYNRHTIASDYYECDPDTPLEKIKEHIYPRIYNYILMILISKTCMYNEPK